jgi:flavin-dependent dehydrogenase
MERHAFRKVMAGQDVTWLFCSDTDRDADFDGAVADPRVVAEVWDAWREEVNFAERFVADSPNFDVTGSERRGVGQGEGSITLREVVLETIHEYARHLGQADLLRERIDGRIGQ